VARCEIFASLRYLSPADTKKRLRPWRLLLRGSYRSLILQSQCHLAFKFLTPAKSLAPEILQSCSEERSDDMTDCGADRINAEWLIYLVDDEFDAF
jgi:hypothetical protein